MTWYAIDPDDIAEDVRVAVLSDGAFALYTLVVLRMLKRGHLKLSTQDVKALWGGRVKRIESRWEEIRNLFEVDESDCIFLSWVDESRADTEKRLKSDAYRQRQHRLKKTEQGSPDGDCHSDVTRDIQSDVTRESHRTSHDTGQTGQDREDRQTGQTAPAGGEGKPRRASKPKSEPKGHPDHKPCVEFWMSEWARTRGGDKYAFQVQDGVAIAWMLKQGDAQEVRARMTRMLESSDYWVAQNASVAVLRSQWNRFGSEVKVNGSARPGASQRVTGDDVVREAARAAGYQW